MSLGWGAVNGWWADSSSWGFSSLGRKRGKSTTQRKENRAGSRSTTPLASRRSAHSSRNFPIKEHCKPDTNVNCCDRTGSKWHMWILKPGLSLRSESRSVMSDSLQLHSLFSSWNSPGLNTGMGIPSLVQGILPTQGWNPGLPHGRRILYQLSHKRSLRILEWVAFPFSRASSWPRDRTRVACIAGRFFTNWAIQFTDETLSASQERRIWGWSDCDIAEDDGHTQQTQWVSANTVTWEHRYQSLINMGLYLSLATD